MTPAEFEKAMQNAVIALEKEMKNILLNGANLGEALMEQRIVNKGLTFAGNQMNYKSAPYKRLRTDAGLKTGFKDLTFTGNLFNSLKILEATNGRVAYGFNNSRMAEIAGYQETSDVQVKERIFGLNPKEDARVQKQMSRDVTKLVKMAIEGYPKMPTLGQTSEEKSINKSIARNKKKQLKKAKKKKSSPIVEKLDKSIRAKQTRGEIMQKKLLSTNIKATNTIKQKTKLQTELKANQFKRIDTKKREAYLKGVIKRKEKYIKQNQEKLAKSRNGSKAGERYLKTLNNHRKDLSKAKAVLAEVRSVKPLKKQIATTASQVKKLRSSVKTQTDANKAYKKKTNPKLLEQRRIKRARQLREGTYKPKKRK